MRARILLVEDTPTQAEIAKVLAKDTDELKKKFVFQDWKTINAHRSDWIEKFNRDIKI